MTTPAPPAITLVDNENANGISHACVAKVTASIPVMAKTDELGLRGELGRVGRRGCRPSIDRGELEQ